MSRGRIRVVFSLLFLLVPGLVAPSTASQPGNRTEKPRSISGVYPHLAMYNNENECGTGAVVPWAGRLWVVTYGPHLPFGSSDKLYEITPDLRQIIRPESVGGTPANRMVHTESNQLLIGPYVIDGKGNVRVIEPHKMPGRLTGNARHLTDPANRIYYATMEEGLYDVDVRSLDVVGKIRDGNPPGAVALAEAHPAPLSSLLPGYHGKGLYSGQGRVIYANNGEHGEEALRNPAVPSGALAEWRGSGDWSLVRRNQFTEVSGPGGIRGNASPDTDPLWSIGWDHRSLILMLLDRGEWYTYRLPKASHCYDGAHGWNTEWPRIREIGETDLLMTMHGMLWRFPVAFSKANSAGIAPRSTYLKVIGDFARWGDRVVFGCDDSARSEFLNKRKTKGEIAGPGQSHSNLWFIDPADLDRLGPPLGRGGVWVEEDVKANQPSDPFVFSGFERRGVHLAHESDSPVRFTFEVDEKGNGNWSQLLVREVPASGYAWVAFESSQRGAWIRLRVDRDCRKATAYFCFSNNDHRSPETDARFKGLAGLEDKNVVGGLMRAQGDNRGTLHFAAVRSGGGDNPEDLGLYELTSDLSLRPVEKAPDGGAGSGAAALRKQVEIPVNVITADAASVLYVDERGRRWRLPKGSPRFDHAGPLRAERVDREVVTERDLFNCHGTFYELPAENAGGFAKIRPIATHNRRIHDYCSYRGLLLMSGIADPAPSGSPHLLHSSDGKATVWAGVVDDLWRMGKPRGYGGPWSNSPVSGKTPSDPYLMSGYDRKSVRLSHDGTVAVTMGIEIDLTGEGLWKRWKDVVVPPGQEVGERFPAGFEAYWVRLVADRSCRATASFRYE